MMSKVDKAQKWFDSILGEMDDSQFLKWRSQIETIRSLLKGQSIKQNELRDRFASLAMQGELASQAGNFEWPNEVELSKRAYLIADAMMEARK